MNLALTLVDAALGCLALELLGVIIVRTRGGRGPSLPGILGSLAAGAALLGALHAALAGTPWPQVPVFLGLALLGHGWDTWGRWRRAG